MTPNTTFKPFIEDRLLPPSGPFPAFHPTIEEKETLPSPSVPAPMVANPVETPPSQVPARKCSPELRVEREGERIAKIEIKCSCGEVIELGCDY